MDVEYDIAMAIEAAERVQDVNLKDEEDKVNNFLEHLMTVNPHNNIMYQSMLDVQHTYGSDVGHKCLFYDITKPFNLVAVKYGRETAYLAQPTLVCIAKPVEYEHKYTNQQMMHLVLQLQPGEKRHYRDIIAAGEATESNLMASLLAVANAENKGWEEPCAMRLEKFLPKSEYNPGVDYDPMVPDESEIRCPEFTEQQMMALIIRDKARIL